MMMMPSKKICLPAKFVMDWSVNRILNALTVVHYSRTMKSPNQPEPALPQVAEVDLPAQVAEVDPQALVAKVDHPALVAEVDLPAQVAEVDQAKVDQAKVDLRVDRRKADLQVDRRKADLRADQNADLHAEKIIYCELSFTSQACFN
jgi:hypothetical protein